MIRFLQVLLGIVLIRLLWSIFRGFASRGSSKRAAGDVPRAEYRGEVVGCERCDLHVPRKRAVTRRGRTFCSTACARGGAEAA